jgi:DDE_Tnp_1-associated
MLANPQPYFANLADPRRETKNKLHSLNDSLMIVLCAVLSGMEDWVGMPVFAQEKAQWLRGFLRLPQGTPSHDTLCDVMGRIDPRAFGLCLRAVGARRRAGVGGRAGGH